MGQESGEIDRRSEVTRVLKKYHGRLARKVEALRGDLAECQRAHEFRVFGETLLTYIKQVPARASEIVLPDPSNASRNLTISLDPAVTAQVNAARYFRRAAKAERGLKEVPPRLSATEAEAHAVAVLLHRVAVLEEGASDTALRDDAELNRDLEVALRNVPEALLGFVRVEKPARTRTSGDSASRFEKHPSAQAVARGEARAPSARLAPRRLKTTEGWDVLIGRNNEGNDYLTHHLARSEDYWFHVHGCPGSHVVLRRGKSKDEPSKKTVDEVASWAAFYSQARTAGKVPVIVTRKKYVRKPRKGPPGLALCTNEKTLIVRPVEPAREMEADSSVGDEAE